MKNFYSKLVAMLLCFLMVFAVSATSNVSAAETMVDFGEPIEVLTYIDEDGNQVVEKLYLLIDNNEDGITTFSTSGSGTYRKEATIKWDEGTTQETIFYAEGKFTQGNGDVSVSNANGGWDYMPSNITVSNKDVKTETGRYGLIFNKYASVTFSFTTKSIAGVSRNRSVTIRISESGNNI